MRQIGVGRFQLPGPFSAESCKDENHISRHHRHDKNPEVLQISESPLATVQIGYSCPCKDCRYGIDIEDEVSALFIFQQLPVEQRIGAVSPPADAGFGEFLFFAKPPGGIALSAVFQNFLIIFRELYGILIISPIAFHAPCRRQHRGKQQAIADCPRHVYRGGACEQQMHYRDVPAD